MTSIVGLFASTAPYHVLAYGTLLGSEIFQTFIGGIVAFKVLARPQFSALQQQLFPWYFDMQTYLPVILALTYPGTPSPFGSPSSLPGVIAEGNTLSVLTPIALMFLSGLGNKFYGNPATVKVMHQRKAQEVRDGKKCTDPDDQLTPELRRLNKEFGKIHGISALINLGGILATVWYGFSLGSRLQ